ncbi:MAG: DUF975 family protein [Lachnospiraceae bacterium]|nr:DUF975 family protein [Lachnospiraceae bacterium]
MNHYLSSNELKRLAKGQLLGKYGITVGILALHLLCTLPIQFLFNPLARISPFLYYMLSLVISVFAGFFTAGEALVYLKVACNQPPAVMDLFHFFTPPVFQKAGKVSQIQLLLSVISLAATLPYTYVGSLLLTSMISWNPNASMLPFGAGTFLLYTILLVAGTAIEVFVQLLLSQIFYLMQDFPEYTAAQLLKLAPKLMKGHKARLFYIQLSFLPLMLLSICSCGLGFLWVYPYMQATYANFYLDLMRNKHPRTS